MLELLLYGIIGDEWDNCDAASVRQWLLEHPEGDILVRINSPGGEVVDGMATYIALAEARQGRQIPNLDPTPPRAVHVMIDGMAASMATVIASVGESVSISDNARYMIHAPWTYARGNAREMRETADRLDQMCGMALKVYAARTGKTEEEINELLQTDTWYSAQEAVDAGWCDHIVQLTMEPDEKAAVKAESLRPSTMQRLKDKAIDFSKLTAEKLHYKIPKSFAGVMAGAMMAVLPITAEASQPENPTIQQDPATPPAHQPASAQETTMKYNLDGTPATTPEQLAAWDGFTQAQKDQAIAAARALERTARGRENASIRQLGARLGVAQAVIDTAIDDQQSFADAARAFAALEAQDEVDAETRALGPTVMVTADRTMQQHERVAEDTYVGLATMAYNRNLAPGQTRRELTPAQNAAASRTLAQIAAGCLQAGGHSVRGMSGAEIVYRAARMQGVHTTSDFAGHLAMGFERVAGQGYDATDSVNINLWTSTTRVKDFREIGIVSAGMFSGLREIPEGGSFEQMTREEYAASVRLRKRGGDFSVSLEAAENDDLGFLSDTAYQMGQRARMDEQKVAEIALIRGVFKDAISGQSRSIFSVDAKTQLEANMEFDVPAFDEATVKLRMQQEPAYGKLWEGYEEDGLTDADKIADRDYLGLRLKLALVGAEAMPLALRMEKAGSYVANEIDKVNPYAGTFSAIPLMYIDPKDFYFMDTPGAHPVVTMVRQRGKEGPQVFPILVNDGLSMRWGVLNRVAAAIVSERGIIKGRRP